MNAITVDVEDWRQLLHRRVTGEEIPPSDTVVEEIETLLELFQERGVRATFFVLHNIARSFPGVVRRIDAQGHEIGSHGLSHDSLHSMTPETFRRETREAKQLLEDLIGKPVTCYRAAEFSITERSLWALDVLAEEGFSADSSIFPFKGSRYGIQSFSARPTYVPTRAERPILELPLTVVQLGRLALPVAGGGYLRLMPYWMTAAAIRWVNRQQRPAVVYVHPYEVARKTLALERLRITPFSGWYYLRFVMFHNLLRRKIYSRLDRLLREFPFGTVSDIQRAVQAPPP